MIHGLKLGAASIVSIIILQTSCLFASAGVKTIISNIEKNDKQSVLVGNIDTLDIIRGSAEFHLGPGELTLFDFGSGRIAAMTYIGTGHFIYTPPDEVEMGQLRKFSSQDTLRGIFDHVTFFFTVELDKYPDTINFSRTPVGKAAWGQLKDAREEAWDHFAFYMPNKLIGDLIVPGPGSFLYADFNLKKFDRLSFIEDPAEDDQYRLCKQVMMKGSRIYDILCGYSPDNDLVSQRGILPIDIERYAINSRIETSGKMIINCRISFTPLRWGRQFLYFGWYPDNKIISICDSNGDTLQYINRKDEAGFGVILNEQMELGQKDSIDITYECKAMENIWGVYYMYLTAPSCWYPWNHISDKAAFDLTFDHSKDYTIVAVGDSISTALENDRVVDKRKVDKPVILASFSYGAFETKDFPQNNGQLVKVFMSQSIPHAEIAQYLGSLGELSGSNMLDRVGSDITRSLKYFTELLGPCPFEAIKVSEIPLSIGQGPPGMIFLSWLTFQGSGSRGNDFQFRAHEVSHQWWGQTIDNESYRDTWIIEGLADYSGFCAYQAASLNMDGCQLILDNWRDDIMSGAGTRSDGSKAGPVTMGYRLASSISDDYAVLVYKKGAYIFHMIRYLMHDFKTGSDEAFATFLKNLIAKYKNRPITSDRLQKLLEEQIEGDMGWFFNQWVYGTDIPVYEFGYKTSDIGDSAYAVTCHIRQEEVPENFQMIVPLKVIFDNDKYAVLKVLVDKSEIDIDLPPLQYKPKKIIFNPYDAVLCQVKYK